MTVQVGDHGGSKNSKGSDPHKADFPGPAAGNNEVPFLLTATELQERKKKRRRKPKVLPVRTNDVPDFGGK